MKIQGREKGNKCVIIDVIDRNFVVVTGPEVKRRRVNMDHLIAGGLLHDVGKLLEIEKDGSGGYKKSRNGMCARHPISGAILAGKAGLPDEIINIIACHAKEGEGRPQVVETILIHQVDFACFNPLVMLAGGKLITD